MLIVLKSIIVLLHIEIKFSNESEAKVDLIEDEHVVQLHIDEQQGKEHDDVHIVDVVVLIDDDLFMSFN